MTIYLQSPDKTQIVVFENENAIGAGFINWIQLTQSEIDDYLLALGKDKKLKEAKTKRDAFQSIPVSIANNTYKSTREAKLLFWSKVNGAVAGDYPIKWRLSDDKTLVYLSKDQANLLYEAFENQEASGFDQETSFLVRIDEAKTLEELNAIQIEYK